MRETISTAMPPCGEIGKTDNGIVVVTSHLYDGTKSLPLDIELYQHANSLPEGKKDVDVVHYLFNISG